MLWRKCGMNWQFENFSEKHQGGFGSIQFSISYNEDIIALMATLYLDDRADEYETRLKCRPRKASLWRMIVLYSIHLFTTAAVVLSSFL